MSAENKTRAFIGKENLIKKGDRILLGLSGGADSVCLFYLLLGLKEELGFALRAAHVHHGIRAEAEEDVTYVQALCEKEGIRLYLFREDVPAYAEKHGMSNEEAGRLLRYRDFEESLRSWQAEENERSNDLSGIAADELSSGEKCCAEPGEDGLYPHFKIAAAHHGDDQAETVLFKLFRGCGLAGLRGMLPERGHIIRPLLCLSREEIEGFLRERGILWREDATNKADDYARNKIRHRILPCADREISGGAAKHIVKTAEIVREAEEYLGRQTKEAYARTAKEAEGGILFDIPALHREDIFIRKQLLLYGIGRLSAGRKDIGAVHVEDVFRLSEKKGNGELSLPGGITAEKCYQKLALFQSGREGGEDKKARLGALSAEEKGFLCGEDAPQVSTERIDLAEEESVKKRFGIREISEIMHCIPEKTYTKWFDYDRIIIPFSVRRPESGDYLTIDREMNRKSFRRYLMEEKVPAAYRGRIWLLAAGSHVIWVPGGRMSSYYKVTEETKAILQVQICGEERRRKAEEKTWRNM